MRLKHLKLHFSLHLVKFKDTSAREGVARQLFSLFRVDWLQVNPGNPVD